MNADQATLAQFAAAVESLQPVETWQAWKLGERESLPIDLDAATLDEAVSQALSATSWHSGDILAVQHSHAGTGKFTLWQFAVKKSTRNGHWREALDGGRPVFVGRMEPKLLCQTALAVSFAPVEPFDAFRDDPVGIDRALVEQK